MINDRGSIKWASMMIPEHVKLLKEYDESLDKVEKPILDEHQFEVINQTICDAMEHHKELVFTYYEKGDIKLYVGLIHLVDTHKKKLKLLDVDGNKFTLKFDDILRVDFHEVQNESTYS